MAEIPFDATAMLAHFGVTAQVLRTEQLTAGHINRTYCVFVSENGQERRLVLQKINTSIFQDVDGLMRNIFAVTEHLRGKIAARGGDTERECLHFRQTVEGLPYYKENDGSVWRVYTFVDRSYTLQKIDKPETFAAAGRAFGRFQNLLADFPGASLAETLPDFHNTPVRFAALEVAAQNNAAGRLDEVAADLAFARTREEQYGALLAAGLPVRVTHNDTKLNNVIFDEDTGDALCVIDLDTVMPGLAAYDFGDAIRFGASTAAEDEPDTRKVALDLALFEAYTAGYLSEAGEALTDREKETLPIGAWLMTMECGMRFLADYLNGDVYFHVDAPTDNLHRARAQFALAADMERKRADLDAIIERFR
ncbi:MAG: aminoglycoside phosphotransferase family protein [Oscillospiraceae bacterium]|nr:aminoglycoside phosphotransferase family protein [Oscillospiraceae bacterium]